MTSLLCLQGGHEFGPLGAAMDLALIDQAAERRAGPVVIAPLASAEGAEYDRAGANGHRHFTSLGSPAVIAPGARVDPGAAAKAWREASLLVLPGGSPGRLLNALHDTGFDELLVTMVANGTPVMGASAGAMVLAERTWLPDRALVVAGVGLVPGYLVLPHWDGQRPIPAESGSPISGLGVPEQSGVLVEDGIPRWSVGHRDSVVLGPEGPRHALPRPPSVSKPARHDSAR